MEEKENPSEGPHFVGKKEELIQAKRSFRTLGDRDILIIHNQGTLYAMDSYCYHAGGDLQNGDIEELDGKMCIICPNHKYKITLSQGEGIYKATDPTASKPVRRWFSKGIKQRTHTVTENNNGDVFVELSSTSCFVESDYYQGEQGKINREQAAEADKKKS